MERYDIAVIGGGVIGGMILRELSRYNLRVCMLEKESDVSLGASRANTGIVHGGFDALEGTKKAKFNVLGAKLMPTVAKELGVKYLNNGTLVVGFSKEDEETLKTLYERGIANGVEGLELVGKEELLSLESNVSENAVGALRCKSAGTVCPYELTIAAIGNAMDNGAALYLDFEVCEISKGENFKIKAKDGRQVCVERVINAAGIYSDKVANMVGDTSFTIGVRKGEYMLLDKSHAGTFGHSLFFCPGKGGKGIVVTQTVDGNILLGPTAEETEDREDKSTTAAGLAFVREKAAQMSDKIPFWDTITSFTGLRSYADRHDFIIERSEACEGFINVAGIESPGLTAAPAIAKEVVALVGETLTLTEKAAFNPYRKPDYFFKNLSVEEKNALIEKDGNYGKIVCRCEEITLGEILRAVRENPKARTVDGVKYRTRAGMGRCQGGFCQPSVVKIIAEELNIPLTAVEKSGKGSNLLLEETK